MVIARSTKQLVPVKLDIDKDEPTRTTFNLRNLSHRTFAALRAKAAQTPQDANGMTLASSTEAAAMMEVAVRAGVFSANGLTDESGQSVELTRLDGEHEVQGVLVRDPLTSESFDLLPLAAIVELTSKVFEVNTLSKAQQGN